MDIFSNEFGTRINGDNLDKEGQEKFGQIPKDAEKNISKEYEKYLRIEERKALKRSITLRRIKSGILAIFALGSSVGCTQGNEIPNTYKEFKVPGTTRSQISAQ